MLIDTHAHLDYEDFAADFEPVLERARGAGVERLITIGTSVESSRRAVELAEKHPMIHAVVGVHPTTADEATEDMEEALRELTKHPRVCGIGETGLDYHRLPEGEEVAAGYKARPAEGFRQQLGGTPAQAEEVLAMGHLVSFTGIATFKNGAGVRETAAAVPADRFMVETDCPYLAPVPYRGKRCEPAHTRETAVVVAMTRGMTLEQMAAQTTANAEAFFRFNRA